MAVHTCVGSARWSRNLLTTLSTVAFLTFAALPLGSAASTGSTDVCNSSSCEARQVRADGTRLMQKRTSIGKMQQEPAAKSTAALCETLNAGDCPLRTDCAWSDSKALCHVRIAWFHVPKAATSFGTTLAHYANSSLPERAHMPAGEDPSDPEDMPTMPNVPGEEPYSLDVNFFLWKYPYQEWFTDVFWHPEDSPGAHRAITDGFFLEWKGTFVGLFRQPESRTVSAFNYFAKGVGDVNAWAKQHWGLQTKMLAASASEDAWDAIACEIYANATEFKGYDEWMANCNESAEELVPLALDRLQTGFAFVGLTEEFDLSVCLLHRMLGGECVEVEFNDLRAADSTKQHSDPSSQLESIQQDPGPDPWDNQIYDAAAEIFWRNVDDYGVSRSSCALSCPGAADIFAVDTSEDAVLLQTPHRKQQFDDPDFEYNWPGRRNWKHME